MSDFEYYIRSRVFIRQHLLQPPTIHETVIPATTSSIEYAVRYGLPITAILAAALAVRTYRSRQAASQIHSTKTSTNQLEEIVR